MQRRILLVGLLLTIGFGTAAFAMHLRSKNPGNWGANRIAEFIRDQAEMDDVQLDHLGEGHYEGTAENGDGRYDVEVTQEGDGFDFELRHETQPIGYRGNHAYDRESGSRSTHMTSSYIE